MNKDDTIDAETLDVTKAVSALAINYGERYLDSLMQACSQQITKLEGRDVGPEEFVMFARREDRAVLNNTGKFKKRRHFFYSIVLWKERPIVETEFSDFFYIRKFPLDQQKQLNNKST